ncbi:MAG: carbohydrate kinase family protein [Phototrophicaceae bacterium]
MAKILVAGLVNIETTIRIEKFPIDYTPVKFAFHGIKSSVSGVGYNIAKALTTLGHDIDFLSLIADDVIGKTIRAELETQGISHQSVLSLLDASPQSAILYDDSGKRMIHSDLKNIQDAVYPASHLSLDKVELAVLANINFSRPLLKVLKQANIPIASDIHTISDLADVYNQDYMHAADILFMSNEKLPTTPDDWVHQCWERFETPIIGIGLGVEGALIAIRDTHQIERIPAKALRPIINTIGSGDALFSAFIHSYVTDHDPIIAMQKAVLFAGYKIGASGGAEGFLSASELDDVYEAK